MSRKAHKGKFTPRCPEKYRGDVNKIIYRSSWEKMAMIQFDESPHVVRWSSEEVVVPYVSVDGKVHRYFVDFWVRIKKPDGTFEERLLEVKPKKQTQAPSSRGKKRNKFLAEVQTWMINQKKWEAAQAFAKQRGMNFYLVTEETLGLVKKNEQRRTRKRTKD